MFIYWFISLQLFSLIFNHEQVGQETSHHYTTTMTTQQVKTTTLKTCLDVLFLPEGDPTILVKQQIIVFNDGSLRLDFHPTMQSVCLPMPEGTQYNRQADSKNLPIIEILFNFLVTLRISTPAGNVNISVTFPPFDKQISQVYVSACINFNIH